jgi:geranylgeranyl pyrophosphate synthase
VLTGDFTLAEALDLVQRSGHTEAMPEFIRTLRVLVRGESIETSNKYNYDISEAQYYDIISEKSASLFALSCKVGALARGVEYADTLGHFGWSLGMAFQMIDDLDDMLDSPNRSYDCDLRNGYLALPLIRVFANLQDGHRDRLIDVIERADFNAETERYVVDLCMECGSIHQTHEEIHRHLDRARTSLDRFQPGEAQSLLTQVLDDLKAYADNQVRNYENFLSEDSAMDA